MIVSWDLDSSLSLNLEKQARCFNFSFYLSIFSVFFFFFFFFYGHTCIAVFSGAVQATISKHRIHLKNE